jgi:hypothetical protein
MDGKKSPAIARGGDTASVLVNRRDQPSSCRVGCPAPGKTLLGLSLIGE